MRAEGAAARVLAVLLVLERRKGLAAEGIDRRCDRRGDQRAEFVARTLQKFEAADAAGIVGFGNDDERLPAGLRHVRRRPPCARGDGQKVRCLHAHRIGVVAERARFLFRQAVAQNKNAVSREGVTLLRADAGQANVAQKVRNARRPCILVFGAFIEAAKTQRVLRVGLREERLCLALRHRTALKLQAQNGVRRERRHVVLVGRAEIALRRDVETDRFRNGCPKTMRKPIRAEFLVAIVDTLARRVFAQSMNHMSDIVQQRGQDHRGRFPAFLGEHGRLERVPELADLLEPVTPAAVRAVNLLDLLNEIFGAQRVLRHRSTCGANSTAELTRNCQIDAKRDSLNVRQYWPRQGVHRVDIGDAKLRALLDVSNIVDRVFSAFGCRTNIILGFARYRRNARYERHGLRR